jgi:mediator of replication checkpoint protein 1
MPEGSPIASQMPSNSPQELTPRSKVKALLAGFDDSDSDSPPIPAVKPISAASPKEYTSTRDSQSSNGSDASNSDSDSEPMARKPIGKMAAKMKGKPGPPRETYSSPRLFSSQPTTPAKLNQSKSSKDQAFKSIFGEEENDASSNEPQIDNSLKSLTPNSSTSKSAASLALPSPGLFVSPTNAHSPTQRSFSRSSSVSSNSGSDDSDMMLNTTNQKLKELVARKKAEKKAEKRARRQEEKEREARRAEKIASDAADLERVVGSESDGEGESEIRKALTQQSRPVRKASKKAIEEMNRETQRISREQHLAHQAKVKKTYRTSDFLKHFNSKRGINETANQSKISDDEWKMSGALVSSDVDQHPSKDTPPTSPITEGDTAVFKPPPSLLDPMAMVDVDDVDEDLPTLEELRSQPIQRKVDENTKHTASDVTVGVVKIEPAQDIKKVSSKPKKVRVILPITNRPTMDDSDDDLEILDAKPDARLIFESIPITKARESNSVRALRNLANLTSPGRNKPKAKGKMTMNELHFNLQAKARQQALRNREERINEARARGIYIPTAEERERDQAELISIEKAREEAVTLGKKEREQRQKDGNDAEDGFGDSEDEEFEYDDKTGSDASDTEDNVDDADDEGEAELSGEEDEEEDDAIVSNPFFDNEAEVGESEEEDFDHQMEILQTATASFGKSTKTPILRRSRNRKVVSDDEDEESESDRPNPATEDSSSKEALGAFGFGQSLSAGLGLSQAFAGTLADNDSQAIMMDTEQDSLDLLRQLPPGSIPEFDNALFNDKLVPDSQIRRIIDTVDLDSVPPIHLGLSQFASQLPDISPSKMSDIPQLTQDVGFAAPREPAGIRVPQSTVDTVPLHTQETPLMKKRGKFRRKASMVAVLSESEGENLGFSDQERNASDVEPDRDAFDVLFKNAQKRKKAEEFNKKRSAAKGMVAEQAEESEDEYKGLGGVSDDDSDGEMDEEVAKMIDEGPVKVDERKIAAFHAYVPLSPPLRSILT